MTWNWVDTLLVACFCWPLISGLRDGMVAGLLKTGFLSAGLLAGVPLASTVAGHLGTFLPLNLRLVAGFLLIVASSWILGRVVVWIWKTALGFTPLGWIDRVLGLGLGVVKGLIFASAMTILLVLAFPVASVQASIRSCWIGNHLVQGQWPQLVQWVSIRLPR